MDHIEAFDKLWNEVDRLRKAVEDAGKIDQVPEKEITFWWRVGCSESECGWPKPKTVKRLDGIANGLHRVLRGLPFEPPKEPVKQETMFCEDRQCHTK